MDERPWYSGFFDDDYLRVFGPVLPEERTAAEVNGVVGQLGLAPGARLLDLCCGPGRHAVLLARLGFRVTGLDLSRRLLAEAAAAAAGQGEPVGLVAGDMRRLPFADASFDAVLNLFHAFGYLEDEAQDELVLAEVARVLAPAGASCWRWPTERPWSGAGTTATSPATTTAWSCSRNGCTPSPSWRACWTGPGWSCWPSPATWTAACWRSTRASLSL